MKNSQKAWITTYTGKKFFLLHPRLKDIDIIDIAHSLSQQCRWTGHSRFHFSVAQHSYYCSLIVPPEKALEALLHDAQEAYLSDISRPLKHYTTAGTAYQAVEHVVENAIRVKFNLPLVQSAEVTQADNSVLYAEKKQIINKNANWKGRPSEVAANIKITPWTTVKAEKMFLKRFKELS